MMYKDPKDVATRLFIDVEEAACDDCGYAYTYELEGCDACRHITEVLKRFGFTDEVDR